MMHIASVVVVIKSKVFSAKAHELHYEYTMRFSAVAFASLGALLASPNATAFSPSARSKVLRDLQEVSMAPPGGRGGAANPDSYSSPGQSQIGPPPDLPSLLLHNRIVYIGMPLVPAVTELVIAELLYLNYEDQNKPVTMYINSSGTTTASGQAVGFETEAFAIADVMKYIRPPVDTIAIGQAFGAAAMILSQGRKGGRAALPNATIRLNQPKSQARGQASDIAIRAREVAHNRRTTCELIAQASGKPLSVVINDCQRVKYLQPDEAVEYGLIDKVIRREEVSPLMMKPAFMAQL